jgi:phosphopantetheinyl transferase (holo-ACP synthase)
VSSRPAPRVHLVTPAIVEQTVARHGVSGVLTQAERNTLDAFPVERRRQDWLAGRLAAKRAVRELLRAREGHAPLYAAIEIANEKDGAPHFTVDDRPDLSDQFNISISHTDGAAVAVAVSATSGSVGVDVEVMRPMSLAVVRRVLRSSEIARLEDDGHAHPSPLALWTAKEAAMKAAHHVCDALCDVELHWIDSHEMRAHVIGTLPSTHAIVVRHREVGPYTVAVALCQ